MTAQAVVHQEEARARVIGHVELTQPEQGRECHDSDNDFLTALAADPQAGARLRSDLDRVLTEIRELQAENRWEDILSLFYPVSEKLPELCGTGMEHDVRLKIGFVLSRAGRNNEAIECLQPVVQQDPQNGLAHYNLAYAAMDALFTVRTERRPMPHREKKRLLGLAHEHFGQACELVPESVTFFYRRGVLYKEIENKPRRAAAFFQQAIANWERKDAETRKKQHQQYPKYIKALYHLASCLLQNGLPSRSLPLVEKVIELDRDRDHMHPVFKHYAMAKVLHALGRADEALEHLDVAAYRADRGQPVDFVFELAARCALHKGEVERAANYIDRIPASRRRPYVRWTEADILAARGMRDRALAVLRNSAERDRRSRHKALLRMARIELAAGRDAEAEQLSREAAEFCRQTFGSPSHEALFWQAAALYRLGRYGDALVIVEELEHNRFRYPNFSRLAGLIRQGAASGDREKTRLSLVQ
jgi:tetratricopeptide (TPR) repeat protein